MIRQSMRSRLLAGFFFCCIFAVSCPPLMGAVAAEQQAAVDAPVDYVKREVRIAMRDGVTLHTVIYRPVNSVTGTSLPILLARTPYGCNPYGEEKRSQVMYNPYLVRSGYIVVDRKSVV